MYRFTHEQAAWPPGTARVDHRLAHFGVPIRYGLPLGHGATLATLPLGVQATLDAGAMTVTIDEPALAG